MKYYLLILCFIFLHQANAQVKLNEACSGNTRIIKDEAGTYQDYAEIYNPTKNDIRMKNWMLIDDRNKPKSDWFIFPDTIIKAGGHLLIWCDGTGALSTKFGLSKSGDSLILIDDIGDISDWVAIPALPADSVYHRTLDGAGTWKITSASTPGKHNSPVQNNSTELPDNVVLPFPNPTVDFVHIPAQPNGTLIRWLNLQGQVVSHVNTFQPTDTQIPVPNHSGIYILQIISNKKIQNYKIKVAN